MDQFIVNINILKIYLFILVKNGPTKSEKKNNYFGSLAYNSIARLLDINRKFEFLEQKGFFP